MNKPKLVLIEGLPCSGKTFLGNNLSKHLNNDKYVKYYEELDKNNLINTFPFFKYLFNNQNIMPKYKPFIINEWSRFIKKIRFDKNHYIIEAEYIMGAVFPMYWFCIGDNEMNDIYEEIAEIITKVDTKLIYLDYESVDELLKQNILLRGADCVDSDMLHYVNLPICKKNNYIGKEGWLSFWNNWFIKAKKIINDSKNDKIVITSNYKDYENNFNKIVSFLNY